MSFAVSFTVVGDKAYPTRKRVHLIENTGGNISTVERSYLNQAIYELYGQVSANDNKTYYGTVNIVRRPTRPYTTTLTEDSRVTNLFQH